LSYMVTQDDVDAGEIINIADATGTDPFGTVVEIQATETISGPDQEPALNVVKTASIGGTTVGSAITYTLTVENTGNVSLTPPVIVDTMARNNGRAVSLDAPFAYLSGDADNDNLIDVTETWAYTAAYTLGQADLNAGGLTNSVLATSQSPDGTTASDTSDNGNDSDGNATDDPTVVPIIPGPAINTVKTIVSGIPALDEVITYEIVATNVGNVTLIAPTITDTITRLDGGAVTGETTGPTLTSGNADGIDPGEMWVWSLTYKITQDDVDAGGFTNTATAGGTDPTGVIVTDQSDNGNDGDGNTTDDVTRLDIIPVPGVTTIKELISVGDSAGEQVVYLITVTNIGETTLNDITITDTMTNNDGLVLSPVNVAVASGDPALVPVDTFVTYDVTYTLTQDDIDSGGVSNTATATGLAPNGATVSDVSDIPTGGDGSTPTAATITQVDSMVATKVVNTPTRIAPDLFEVIFTMTLENTGNVTQTGLVLDDDLTAFVAPATLSTVSTPVISGFATGTVNGAYNGTSNTELTSADTSLLPGATGIIELTVLYNVSGGNPAGANVFSAVSDRIATAVTASTGVISSEEPDILAIKTVTPDRATVGQTVTYTISFINNLATAEGNLTLVDAMPVGLTYTPDSATYNGASTPQPDVEGRTLLWRDVTIGAGDTVTLTVQARVTDGGLGDIVNEAYALDPSGARVSNIASATLRLPVEAVFDCADIIGKVFDDRNMNGYQDGVLDDGAISDQTYYADGKFQIAPEIIEPNSEPGLSNVRLSTVTGTIITTDEYGRFSVPCAELPGDIGTNFTLKLDTRSLPSGFQLTTENPRVIRVTAGTMARLNFGATIATVVDIDLLDSAFAPGSAEITPALRTGVDQLIAALREDPSVLRLTYYRANESQQLARARMDNLEAFIRQQWRRGGAGRLPIERSINRLQ
ncbi:MAG: beta strand repeat-containing protein, partial [Octadecabacter sp.]